MINRYALNAGTIIGFQISDGITLISSALSGLVILAVELVKTQNFQNKAYLHFIIYEIINK